jgi:hypothetical protein
MAAIVAGMARHITPMGCHLFLFIWFQNIWPKAKKAHRRIRRRQTMRAGPFTKCVMPRPRLEERMSFIHGQSRAMRGHAYLVACGDFSCNSLTHFPR